MNKLTAVEQKAVADIKAIYDKLGADAQAEAAKVVSFAEKHFPLVALGLVAGGFILGLVASASF